STETPQAEGAASPENAAGGEPPVAEANAAAKPDAKSKGWKGNLGFAFAFLLMLGGGYFVGQWAIDYFRPVELEEGDRYSVELRGDEPQLGDAGALVTIVEFSDFQCPFCGRAAEPLLAAVESYDPDEV